MKPQTKLQKKVVRLNTEIKPLTKTFKEWAKKKMDKYVAKHYSSMCCMECNHMYKGPARKVCPNCKSKVKYIGKVAGYAASTKLFEVITVFKGFQVIRIIQVEKVSFKKELPSYYFREVIQHWIRKDGKVTILSLKSAFSYYSGINWNGELEVRSKTSAAERRKAVTGLIYIKSKIIPNLKRNGYNVKELKSFNTQYLMEHILSNPKIETLVKLKEYELLSYFIGRLKDLEEHWNSIKIALRNDYVIHDVGIWVDNLELLKHFSKNIHNPKYICPKDLLEYHQKLIDKKKEEYNKQALERRINEIEKAEDSYKEKIKKFSNFKIENDNIVIEPLKTVKDFYEEGIELSHCIFTNKYYETEDSLILSAKIDGVRIETIEIDLNSLSLEQARGKSNAESQYHDEIVNLVNNNLNQLERMVNGK